MDKCQSCGAELVKNAKFCIICGAVCGADTQASVPASSVTRDREQKTEADTGKDAGNGNICAACGFTLREGARFCVSCGGPVEKAAAKISPVQESKPGETTEAVTTGRESREQVKAEQESVGLKDQNKPPESKPVKKELQKEDRAAEIPVSPDERKLIEPADPQQWTVKSGDEPAREADELDLVPYGRGTVLKVVFQKPFPGSEAVLKGKLKCHGCSKLSLFSMDLNRGWGSSNEPVTCPCGSSIEIGEYWNDSTNAVFVWASLVNGDLAEQEYPLTISVSKVLAV